MTLFYVRKPKLTSINGFITVFLMMTVMMYNRVCVCQS